MEGGRRTRARRLNAFHELQSASASTLEALEALSRLLNSESGQLSFGQEPRLSFALLKKHALQLSVQAHKCTRLLTTITGKEDAALRAALSGQLKQIGQLLEDNPLPENEALFRRLPAGWQATVGQYLQQEFCSTLRLEQAQPCQPFTLTTAAGWYFFHKAKLFPRINHSLQQLDNTSWASLTAVSAKIQHLIMTCPLPDTLRDGLNAELRHLFSQHETHSFALFPQVHSEDGKRSSFAGLCPALRQIAAREAGAVEEAYKHILASLYAPQSLAYIETKGLRHERTGLAVLCLPESAICAEARCSQQMAVKKINGLQSADAPNPLWKGYSGSAGLAAGTVHMIRSLADTGSLPEQVIAVVPQASMEWTPLLPRIAALLIEADCGLHPLLSLAREFHLPVVSGPQGACSLLHDGMPVTVDATHGLVYAGIIKALVEKATPRPNSRAGSPAAKTLRTLCAVAGVSPVTTGTLPLVNAADASGCSTMLDLVFWCRFRAAQALLQYMPPKGAVCLSPSLCFEYYDIEGVVPADASDNEALVQEVQEAADALLLQPLWRGMRQQVELESERIAALNGSTLKNTVLLGPKYCTLQLAGADFLLCLMADADDHGRYFHLMLWLEDTRPRAAERLSLLAPLLQSHDLTVQATQNCLRAFSIRKDRHGFENDLHFLGTVTIQALA